MSFDILFKWYRIKVKFVSPRTESCTLLFHSKAFIMNVLGYVLFIFWCQEKPQSLKIVLNLQGIGDFGPQLHDTDSSLPTHPYMGHCPVSQRLAAHGPCAFFILRIPIFHSRINSNKAKENLRDCRVCNERPETTCSCVRYERLVRMRMWTIPKGDRM